MSAGTVVRRGVIEPSFWNALPHFAPLAIFPLVVQAALYGGWWIAGPFAFLMLADRFDNLLGMEERNMDPGTTLESQLFLYKLALWLWAALWPVTLVFTLWQILVAGHLSIWEAVLMAMVLGSVAQTVFVVGHELVHRRSTVERRVGEILLASVSYPHYATEHVYIHHPHVCTPGDPGSAPRGLSFWRYLPREVASNIVGAWRFESNLLARRRLPVWHYTNAFWRYILEISAWYALVFWMGGVWAVLIFASVCSSVVFSMKLSNYVQHYGLRRVRLPNGRFERVEPRHAWSAGYRFTNWLYYNMQRHADHHTASNRRYPLLQHHGAAESPQLPGSYVQMNGLALFSSRWFETMNPLLDRQRAHFYPQIDDWSAYDSEAFAARPDAFEAIAEIHAAAPRLAAWINRAPALLDSLRDREFTDLELPDGFGPDPEYEAIARRGLALLYWTRELGVSEMRDQLADVPVQDGREAMEAAREWSNNKVFQIAVHTMRGSLSPREAGTALSNVAEASIFTVLSAVEEDFAERRAARAGSGVAAVVLGDLASGEAAPGAELDVVFVYDGGPAKFYDALCRRFFEALRALSRDNLLLAPVPRGRKGRAVRSLDEFMEHHRTDASGSELLDLTRARCFYASGESGMSERFDAARRDILAHGAARDTLIAELRGAPGGAAEPGLLSIDDMRGGLRDVERAARFLQVSDTGDATNLLPTDAVSVFQTAGACGSISDGAAERLADAARMWRNLQGILRLVAEDGCAIDTASPTVKTVIARACGNEDFGALIAAIGETAARAATDIGALDGVAPPAPLSHDTKEERPQP